MVDEELDMPGHRNELSRNSPCPGLLPTAWTEGEGGFCPSALAGVDWSCVFNSGI